MEPFEAPFLIAHTQYTDFTKGWARGLAGEIVDLEAVELFEPDCRKTRLGEPAGGLHLQPPSSAGMGASSSNSELLTYFSLDQPRVSAGRFAGLSRRSRFEAQHANPSECSVR